MWEAFRRFCCNICGQTQDIPPPAPLTHKEITQMELYKLLREKFPEAQLYLSDRTYKACMPTDIITFLERDKTNKMGYVKEDRDCDDFAYRLMGQFSIPGWSDLAFGIVWTNVHALNCFIDYFGVFHFIEPQTDKIRESLEGWQGDSIRVIMM